VLAALAAVAPTASIAKPGELDRTFGKRGRVEAKIDRLTPARVHLATAADGSIVATRGDVVLRYGPNGDLDPRFGEAGKLTVTAVEGLPFMLTDVAFDAEGRVLVFGTATDPSITREIPGYVPIRVNPSFAVVMRFDATGKLDSGFGDGDGIVRSSLGFQPFSTYTGGIPLASIDSARLDSAGRIVMAIGELGLPPSEGHPHFGWVTDALARLMPSGDLDPTFGGGDGIADDLLSRQMIYSDFCISTGDEPVIASSSFSIYSEYSADPYEPTSPQTSWLTRLRGDGSLDPAFGMGGSAYVRGGSGPLTCEDSGRLIMLQQPDFQPPDRSPFRAWKIVRASASGRVDRRFGDQGRAIVKQPDNGSPELASVAVDSRGRVLLAGSVAVPKRSGRSPRAFLTVIRLLPSGKPDRRFGRGGWIRTDLGQRTDVSADDIAIDMSGRLLIGGRVRSGQSQPDAVVLARYLTR